MLDEERVSAADGAGRRTPRQVRDDPNVAARHQRQARGAAEHLRKGPRTRPAHLSEREE